MSKEEIDAQFLNDTLMFSELFAIISRDLLQAVCKRLEQIHHGNTSERPERCHERPDGWAGRLSAHFLSAQLEFQKCGKLVGSVQHTEDLI
jgi:hypothetical protein